MNKVLPLIALLFVSCALSEKDSPLAPLQEAPDTTAVVLLWSQPRAATVEISRIEGGELVPLGTATTPVEQTLQPGSYAFQFSKEGHETRHGAILLGPGSFETVGVDLDSLTTPPQPAPRPTATLTVSPNVITLGETVDIVASSANAELGFIAPTGVFTLGGTYSDEPWRTGTFVYTFPTFGAGGVAVAADTVTVLPRPAPAPWLTAEGRPDTVGVRQFGYLDWSCNADHVRIIGPHISAGNRGAIGILPIRFDEVGTSHYTVVSYDAADRPVLTSEVTFVAIEEPTPPPAPIVMTIPVDSGVTTLEGDQEEVLVDLVALPPNTGIRVRAELEYSGDSQLNEAAAIGFRSGAATIWATRDGEDCPVISDQPGVTGRRWVSAGTVHGFTVGSIIFRHAIRHACYNGQFTGRESIYANNLELVVTLR